MRCPFCRSEQTKVVDSRFNRDANATRRRRACETCGRRFTTYERVEALLPVVVKRDDNREPFDREKIRRGVARACEKRPVSVDAIDALVDDVERVFAGKGDKEVNSTEIGEVVMQGIKDLDGVAYVRFASVYRDFRDVNEFMQELDRFLHHGKGRPE
ncbi:MAG: transcriptional regulator NrdR [Bradymonadia bacterium]